MSAPRNVAEPPDFTPLSGEWLSWLIAQERSLVSSLASGIVHDFNNALSTLQTNTFLLRDGCAEARVELIQEWDDSIAEGVELTQQMRSLILEPLTGPAVRSIADLLNTGERLLQQLGSATLLSSFATPADGRVELPLLSAEHVRIVKGRAPTGQGSASVDS